MAINKCKGLIIKHTIIGGALTAIAQVIDLELSGAESETFESTTLDSGFYKTFQSTGYANPGEISGSLFWDPALAGHKNITDQMGTTATAPAASNAGEITWTDAGPATQAYSVVGVGFGVTVNMRDGLKGKFRFRLSGSPGFPKVVS